MEVDEETKPTVEDPEGPEAQARRSGKMIELAHDIFAYGVHATESAQAAQLAPLKSKIVSQIETESRYCDQGQSTDSLHQLTQYSADMTNFYERTCEQLQWPVDSNLLSKLRFVSYDLSLAISWLL